MMTYKENIEEILRCNFAGYKDEIILNVTDRICEIKSSEMNNYFDGYVDGFLHKEKIDKNNIASIENEKNRTNAEGELMYSASEIKIFDLCIQIMKGEYESKN